MILELNLFSISAVAQETPLTHESQDCAELSSAALLTATALILSCG
jgi:hypothetical protein